MCAPIKISARTGFEPSWAHPRFDMKGAHIAGRRFEASVAFDWLLEGEETEREVKPCAAPFVRPLGGWGFGMEAPSEPAVG
jgi:hypothetical protein